MALTENSLINIDEEDINKLLVGWLNILDAHQICNFFWDYPYLGYARRAAGYGIRAHVANNIIKARQKRKEGLFSNIEEVDAVFGMGNETMTDIRFQAKEALSLAKYFGLKHEPKQLWQELLKVGPGKHLKAICKYFILLQREIVEGKRMSSSVNIPFIPLMPPFYKRNRIEDFVRVRVEAWAFWVYPKEYHWEMSLEVNSNGSYKADISKKNEYLIKITYF